ncbi:LPS export ABC transporter permease LptG [Halorhodospira abdelmalekii]|uniref:LPS export ABC transporter permease LptG n=1 Tax=Halorhodospira abdelmalekii TaxID=421629 RepID=UPI00190671C2|nr:LPS export ABC transporter permease LptG [Halorhodospira abdelmalekii]MBK1734803.1 LPS export ABC transporter permease LptG [Halorhodospira abdelmalekii]
MWILTGYLARVVIGASLVALVAILALDFVFALVDGVADARKETGDILIEAALGVPELAYEAFPFATLIGTLMGLGALAARQELTAMRAAGVSVLQIAAAVLAGGLVLALFATAIGEYLVPQAERQAAAMRGVAEADRLRTGPDGALWARVGDDFLRAERPRSSAHLERVTVYRFDSGRLVKRIEAADAHYWRDRWVFSAVAVMELAPLPEVIVAPGEEPGASALFAQLSAYPGVIGVPGLIQQERFEQWQWDGALSPEVLGVVVADPRSLPAGQLATYIRYLEANELDSAQYRLALWEKVATPLATLAMILVTVPLVFTAARSSGAGQRIVLGILLGAGFFLLNRAFGQAGIVYGLPPSLAALLPALLFMAVGVWGTLRVR